MSRPIRIIVALTLALFAATTHAQTANIESVPPQSGGTVWYANWGPGPFASAAAACSSGWDGSRFAGTVPNSGGYAYLGYLDCTFTNPATGKIYVSGTAIPHSDAVCPVPAVAPNVPYQLVWNAQANAYMCERPARDACPEVPALTSLPTDDACGLALENIHTTPAQKNAVCPKLNDAVLNGQSCLTTKLNALSPSIPLSVTADIRTIPYQAHLREVWDKMEDLVALPPERQAACSARRAEIAAEKGCDNKGSCKSCYPVTDAQRSHCLKGKPAQASPNFAQHALGNAFDVSMGRTITPLQNVLNTLRPPQDIQQWLDGPPQNCGLTWGGTFITNNDPVHFLGR